MARSGVRRVQRSEFPEWPLAKWMGRASLVIPAPLLARSKLGIGSFGCLVAPAEQGLRAT